MPALRRENMQDMNNIKFANAQQAKAVYDY